ncbi:MAG: hypothetical protein ABIR96_01130 [Bdellovibrionota bacterium]
MKLLVSLMMLGASVPALAAVSSGCGESEKWSAMTLSATWTTRYQSFSKGQISPIEGMALAHELRKESDSRWSDLFSEYWLSNALLKSGHFPLAESGFERVLARLPQEKEFDDLRVASFQCLGRLHHQYSSRQISRNLYSAIQSLPAGDEKDYWLYRWAIEQNQARAALKQMRSESELAPLLKALVFYDEQEWSKAAGQMDAYFAQTSVHPYLTSETEHWKIFAGRMHYSASTFSKAIAYWNSVDKRSNELVEALTEFSWAQLKFAKYNEAIGTALSLQTGWLSNTYSPEGLMVMSMAFNETCHYPEAMRSSELLRKQYDPVLAWLKDNKKLSSSALYQELVKAMKKESKAPYRLSSEWIRSPRFIARQSEVNALIRMDDRSKESLALAQKRQRERVAELLKLVREIKSDVVSAQKSDKKKVDLPEWINVKLESLRKNIEEYDALRAFAPVWKQADAANRKIASTRRADLIQAISDHVAQTNARVLSQIEDVYDNLQFVEVEIYQGATQDMIFSNSHPDYSKKINELKSREGFRLKSQELNWGQISTEELGQSEIWEDELGGFKADLPNKCDKGKIARSL